MASTDPVQLNLRDFIGVLRRRWIVVAIIVALAAAGVAALAVRRDDRYVSSAEVLVVPPPVVPISGVSTPVRTFAAEVELAGSDEVVAELINRLPEGAESPVVSITSDVGTSIIEFTANSADPELARTTADLVAQTFIDLQTAEIQRGFDAAAEFVTRRQADLEQALARATDAYQAAVANIDDSASGAQAALAVVELNLGRALYDLQIDQRRYADAQDALTLGADLVSRVGSEIISPADDAGDANRSILLYAVIALVLALIFGSIAAFAWDNFDDRVQDADDVERTAGLPVLGVVPRSASATSVADDRLVELALAVRHAARSAGLRRIQIVAVDQGGANVAARLAGAAANVGLSAALVATGAGAWRAPADLLPNGPVDRAIEAAASEGEVVFVETPPIRRSTDGLTIASSVDAAIVVAVQRRTRRGELTDALDSLKRVGTNVIGLVLVSTRTTGGTRQP